MTSKKTEPPLHLDMPFDEALRRFVQTKPEELPAATGRKKKGAESKSGAPKTKLSTD